MADGDHEAETEGGFAFDHPTRRSLPLLIAPTVAGEHNAIRETLTPLACWSIGDVRFEFDSSFVKPEAATETPLLARSMQRHARGAEPPTITIFGHADPVGQDEYNKQLSGRRAAAVYGMLTRDVEIWEDLYTRPFGSDAWGQTELRKMLATLGHEGFGAVTDFQMAKGLQVDGVAGPKTRRALFLAYMDALCIDDSGQPFTVDKAAFMSGGADPGGKGDYQGCGEFNPALVLSDVETKTLPKPERDIENTPNRRVVAFLFRPETHRPPDEWPCPRVMEDTTGCRMRLFVDHERRRTAGASRREYKQTQDTFACRFYDRLSVRSPCEGLRNQRMVELVFDDPFLGPCAGVLVHVAYSRGAVESLVTNASGVIIAQASKGDFADTAYERKGILQKRRIFLDAPAISTDEGAWQRLANLGYVREPLPDLFPGSTADLGRAVQAFQADFRLTPTGSLDRVTRSKLDEAHADRTPWRERAWMDEPSPSTADANTKGSVT